MLTGLAAVFCSQVFLAVDASSHSASNTLYGVYAYFVGLFPLLNWVASKTSYIAGPSVRNDPRVQTPTLPLAGSGFNGDGG